MRAEYKSAFLRCLSLFCVGEVLQIFFGYVPDNLLHYPWSLIVAVNYAYMMVLLYFMARRMAWVRSLFGSAASIASLTSMMLLCIIFGLVPQNPDAGGVMASLGFTDMAHSYPFCLMFAYFITCLALKTIDDIRRWREQRLITLLLHGSLLFVLAASFIGSGDKLRLKVVVPVGHTVHVGYDAANSRTELPFAITLDEFSFTSYAPNLKLFSYGDSTLSSHNISLDNSGGVLEGYDICVEEYLAEAMPSTEGYVSSSDEGNAPAAFCSVQSPSGEVFRGWVCAGSFRVEARMLHLGSHRALVMLPAEPRRYLSRLTVTEQGGRVSSYDVAVNSPARVGDWHIYQSGYDTERGRWSKISVLECVRDGWYPVVHVGLWVVLLSGCLMFLRPKSKNIEEE